MFLVPPPGLMKPKSVVLTPQFIDLSSNGLGNGNSSIQPGLPSHQTGDLLVLIAGVGSGGGTFSGTPSGYSAEATLSASLAFDGTAQIAMWTKIATGSESNPTVNLSSGSGYKVAALMAFRNHGFALASDIVSIAGQLGQGISFNTAGSMQGNTANGNIRIMAWYANRNGTNQLISGTATPPAGSTLRLQRTGGSAGDSASGDRGLFICTGSRPDVGTGVLSISGFVSTVNAALAVDATVEA